MPRYDYECEPCEIRHEVIHSIKEDPEIKCECGSAMQRIISGGGGFVLKGWGWAGKNTRINSQRSARSRQMSQRQMKTWGPPDEAVPNSMDKKGAVQIFKSWDDAGKFAEKQGYDPSGYKKKTAEVANRQARLKADKAG